MSAVPYIQESEWDELVTGPGPVVVDFTATWCGPCRKVSPLMEQLAAEYEDRVKVFKLDVDENKPVAKKFGIRSIPAVLIFKGGEVVENIKGAVPYEDFCTAVDKHL
ncbi:MAG: thioredoxin [Hormoscilla sp.]